MRGLLPDTIIDRRKQGFAVPLGRWFRGALGPYARDLLLSRVSLRRSLFNRSYIERLLAQFDRGRQLDLHLWTLISFEMWCRTFLDRPAAWRGRPDDSMVVTYAVPDSRHHTCSPEDVAESGARCWIS